MILSKKVRNAWSDITFKDVIKSISGTEQDFTSGSLGKAIVLLAIPMVLEMLMESIFALADIFFVSKLGTAAIATVGITESMMTLMYAVAVGLSSATSAVISRRIGEKNKHGASVSSVQAIIIAVGFSILIAIPGSIYAKQLLYLMGAGEDVLNGYMYTRIMFGGNIVIMLLFVINAIFRSAGDAAISFRILFIANIINIILDPCLIFGLGPFPALGVKGAAIATNTGRGLAVIYQLYLLFFGNLRVKIKLRHIKVHIQILWDIFKLSWGGIGQHLIATGSWVIMIRILSYFGDNVVAAYTVAIRIILFTILPSWGLSNAASTLVGQNLGAKKPERAEKSIWLTSYTNMIFLGIISIILISFPEFFIGLVSSNELILNDAAICLRFISYGFVMYGIGMVMMQSINGSGDTTTPTYINILCYLIIEIPLALLLAVIFRLGPEGVYLAILIAECLLTLSGYYIIRKGKWKYNEV